MKSKHHRFKPGKHLIYLTISKKVLQVYFIIYFSFFSCSTSVIDNSESLVKIIPAGSIKHIFILNSYNYGFPWTDNVLRGIDDSFDRSGLNFELYYKFMDMKRVLYSEEYFTQVKETIKIGYNAIRFDAVLASDNDALAFLRKYRDELFPGIPVVFTAINDFNESMLDNRTDITGISENNDYKGTISIALKLRPKAKNLIIVNDDTTTGKAHYSAFQNIEADFKEHLNFTYLSLGDYTLAELGKKLSLLKDDNIVLLGQQFIDKDKISYTIEQSLPFLSNSSSVPCFVLVDIRVGLGTLGGSVASGYHYGYTAANMVIDIIKGADIKSIPVMINSPNQYMFDYIVMKRFNISLNDIPKNSIVLNKPESLFMKYKTLIITTVIILVIFVVFIVLMFLEIMRRRRVEAVLYKNRNMLEIILNSIPIAIFWKDTNSIYQGCNKNCAQIFGIKFPGQIIGKTDFDFPWSAGEAEAYRADDLAVIQNNQSKQNIIEDMQQSDGSRRWIDTCKVPLVDENGLVYGVLGVYQDITEWKKAEEKIQASLLEKEVLLREIFHRTKNNMQVISSFMQLQVLNTDDEKIHQIVKDTISRIQAMSLVHQKLYRSKNLSRIDLMEYIQDLVTSVIKYYNTTNKQITINYNMEKIEASFDTVIPCGLVINEIISNIFKYAFPIKCSGEINIKLWKTTDDLIAIHLSDNGIGLPGQIDLRSLQSLGMQIIFNLIEYQLHGDIDYTNQNGLSWNIRFKNVVIDNHISDI